MKLKKRLKFKPQKVNKPKGVPKGRLNESEAEQHEAKLTRGNFYGKKWYPY